MPLCVQCGVPATGSAEICSHHALSHGDDWAKANRIMCDFLHRGIIPPALPAEHEDIEVFLTAA